MNPFMCLLLLNHTNVGMFYSVWHISQFRVRVLNPLIYSCKMPLPNFEKAAFKPNCTFKEVIEKTEINF